MAIRASDRPGNLVDERPDTYPTPTKQENQEFDMTKTIFITGASTGLGRATAQLFADRGWNVIATMRKPEAGADLAQHERITVVQLDVTVPEQIEAAAKRALELGGIDVLFNNAGYGLAGPLEGTTDEQLMRQINTNLVGVIRLTKAFIPYLREKGNGVVITTTSVGGHIALPYNSLYHATKFALEGWSESASFELGRYGIRVKTIAPGGIKTDFLGRSFDMAQHPAYAEDMQKVLAVLTSSEHVSQYATPEAIAEIVYEAATDDKDRVTYIAGQDAIQWFGQRREVGADAFRKDIRQMIFGD
ncbi:MAG: SDR family oxidoreductase [Myxococcota bacterium]